MPPETALAAFSTIGPVIGSAIGVWMRPSIAHIHSLLYFPAGIMLTISFLDLIPERIHLGSPLTCVAGLSIGGAGMWVLDRLFPQIHACAACGEGECHLGRTANFLILAICVHNFPEDMAIAVGAATDIHVGDDRDYADAQVIAMTAGAKQRPVQNRLDLLRENVVIVEDVSAEIVRRQSEAVLPTVTNPVDVLPHVATMKCGWERSRVLGSGTALDAARLRHLSFVVVSDADRGANFTPKRDERC